MIILDDDDDVIEIDSVIDMYESDKNSFLKQFQLATEIDTETELIYVESASTYRICTAALSYVKVTSSNYVLVREKNDSSLRVEIE